MAIVSIGWQESGAVGQAASIVEKVAEFAVGASGKRTNAGKTRRSTVSALPTVGQGYA